MSDLWWWSWLLTAVGVIGLYLAELWHLVGRRHIWIERRRGDE